jgi:small subunit ribosomal protein S21
MPSVNVNKGGFEKALRQFKRACEKAGLVSRARAIKRHVKPSQKRKQMRDAAVKRLQKKLSKQRETMERERTRH